MFDLNQTKSSKYDENPRNSQISKEIVTENF